MNAAREIANSYTLNQISKARKIARAQGDAKADALLAQAFDLRFDVLIERTAQEQQAKLAAGGVNVA